MPRPDLLLALGALFLLAACDMTDPNASPPTPTAAPAPTGTPLVAAAAARPQEVANMSAPVVLQPEAMAQVRVLKDLIYRTVPESANLQLKADIYYPPDFQPGERRPAVLFIHGNAQLGLKEQGQYLSWGRLAALSGLIGVTFDHRSSSEYTPASPGVQDVDTLVRYIRENAAALGIDPDRLGIWACSAGVPRGVRAAMHQAPYVRAIALYYGFLDLGDDPAQQELAALHYLQTAPQAIAPLLVAKAGKDRPDINTSIDTFMAEASWRNLNVELLVHEQGQHGFDVRNDNNRSRAIIRRTLEFFQQHLRGQ
jgi:acetyl esterase/lipase